LGVTTDNASNNDTFIRTLSNTCAEEDITFSAENNHVRCLAHVMNLAAQLLLSTLKASAVNEDELLNNYDDINSISIVMKVNKSQNYYLFLRSLFS
jgi:hypothetical protein